MPPYAVDAVGVIALLAIAIVLWINRPRPPAQRKVVRQLRRAWRDRAVDEHAARKFIG